MAMVINHNEQATGALNVLNRNNAAQSDALKKLSTGMQINSAGDNASAYSISERMQVQVRSLDQDYANAQTGNNMLQVAEGAVSNTVDILRTMKEKLINAANDTNTEDDRLIFQKEFNQMVEQIDQNAKTQYNGKYMLDGSCNRVVLGTGTATTLTNQALDEDTDVNLPVREYKDRQGLTLGIQANDNITVSYVKQGVTYKYTTKVEDWTLCDIFNFAADPPTGLATDYVSTPPPYSGPVVILESGTDYVGQDVGLNNVYTPDGKNAVTIRSMDGGINGQISGITIAITQADGTFRNAANAALDNFREVIRAENPSDDNALIFQTGTRASRFIKVGLSDMSAQALGLKDARNKVLDVGTQDFANAAINVVEGALTKALDMQTTIGAAEMRMGITGNNINLASENTQASQSQIADADMAKEMMEYTKSNVLQQASQSMLAQANQNSSTVLSLLQ